jgi:hypothetical protein
MRVGIPKLQRLGNLIFSFQLNFINYNLIQIYWTYLKWMIREEKNKLSIIKRMALMMMKKII